MSAQSIVQLFVAIWIIGMCIYYIYKINEQDKKYADKPNKH